MINRRNILGQATVVAAVGAAAGAGAAAAAESPTGAGFQKKPVYNPDKKGGTHAIRLRNVSEWMLFAGHAAIGKNGEVIAPGDAIAQLRWIWGSLTRLLEQEGFSLADVVQIKMTCTKEVPITDRVKFIPMVYEVFHGLPFTPTGSTMSVVDELAFPGPLVEVDITAAR